jgi:hypothetical protein
MRSTQAANRESREVLIAVLVLLQPGHFFLANVNLKLYKSRSCADTTVDGTRSEQSGSNYW